MRIRLDRAYACTLRTCCGIALAAGVALATLAPGAAGATLVEPRDGKHFDHLELAPTVAFAPDPGESPKWVLLATDAGMKTTVRYCRAFTWAYAAGEWHWGCNRWAIGADANGYDVLRELDAGKTYYWQVVSARTPPDGGGEAVEQRSAVRAFAIDRERREQSIGQFSDRLYDSVFDDGTYLNLGAAAYVNSNVRPQVVRTQRLGLHALRINVTYVGNIDARRSYVRIRSAAGTRYIALKDLRANYVRGVWTMNAAERRLRAKRFTYQAFLKSAKNGSVVKSEARVVVIKPGKPRWTPTRSTIAPG